MKKNTIISILTASLLFAGYQTAQASFQEMMYYNQIYASQNNGVAASGNYGNGKCGYEFKNKTYYYDCNKYEAAYPALEYNHRVVRYFDKEKNLVKLEVYDKTNHLVEIDYFSYLKANCPMEDLNSEKIVFYDLNGKIIKHLVNSRHFYDGEGREISKREFRKIKEY